jgi:hypothetical protein
MRWMVGRAQHIIRTENGSSPSYYGSRLDPRIDSRDGDSFATQTPTATARRCRIRRVSIDTAACGMSSSSFVVRLT